jgi:hypothetical protein
MNDDLSYPLNNLFVFGSIKNPEDDWENQKR